VVTKVDAAGLIDRAAISITTTDTSKTYDGNTSATGMPKVSTGILYPGDGLAGGSFAYVDKNYGIGDKIVTVNGVAVGDGVNNNNYTITYVNNTTSTINKAVITINPMIAKIYDGNVMANISDFRPTGLVNGETVTISYGDAQYDNRNVGAGKPVQINGVSLSDGNNGGLAMNYTVSPESIANAKGDIYRANLTLTAVSDTKYFDGNTLSSKTPVTTGLVPGDTVSNLSQRFDSPLTGTRLLFVNPGYLVNDGNGGNNYNYSVTGALGEILQTPITERIDVEIEPKYGYRYKYNASGEHPLKFNLSAVTEVTNSIDAGVDWVVNSDNQINSPQVKNSCYKDDLAVAGNHTILCQRQNMQRKGEKTDSPLITITAPVRPPAF